MGMSIMGIKKDLLVNAWYTGGVNVIDFSNPTKLKETAFYDTIEATGTWSAYPYTGPMFRKLAGIPVYASDGVENNALAEGMVVTIEPGAYIDAPQGSERAMGARIEDDLVVAGGGPEWLTNAPRDLVVVEAD